MELRRFFALVERIRDFGQAQLGLNIGKSYRKYLEIDQDFLVMVVNAARPYSLDPYLWDYPFFGPAPYRGYYNPDHVREEADRLRGEGYEVWVRKVDAFSTLGITSDPLISFMQSYSEFQLARLIIHEQVHATLWVDRAIQFNEELAAALDTNGALEYFAWFYGRDSAELKRAEAALQDSGLYLDDLRELASRLDTWFAENPPPADAGAGAAGVDAGYLMRRNAVIREFQDEFAASYADRYISDAYRGLADIEINTAYLSLFRTYSERGRAYHQLYENIGSVKETLELIQAALDNPADYGISYQRGDDPFLVVEGLLGNIP